MEGLTAILVQAAAGILGGGAAGNTPRAERLGLPAKLVAGAVGGVAAGALAGALLAALLAGDAAPVAAEAAAATAGTDWRMAAAQIVGALVGGGLLTAIVGGLAGKA